MRATPPRAKPFCDLTAAADLAIDQGVSASKQPIILRTNRIGLAKMARRWWSARPGAGLLRATGSHSRCHTANSSTE